MIITTYDDYIENIIKIIENNTGKVRISSFGLFIRKHSRTEYLFNLLKDIEEKEIIVGVSYYLCQDNCVTCINKQLKKSKNYKFLNENYNIKITKDLHLKFISRGDQGLVGGINLTNSHYFDMSVAIKNKKLNKANQHFDNVFNTTINDHYFELEDPLFTFGKYTGKKISEIKDDDYLRWCSENLDNLTLKYLKLR